MKVLIVMCNVPDAALATQMATVLVEAQLAACVNILAPCQSVYRWQGKTECASEIPLLIKTTSEQYGALEAKIQALHPYEVPEIVALPLENGLSAYLGWVVGSVAPLS